MFTIRAGSFCATTCFANACETRNVPLRWTAIDGVPHRLVHLEEALVAQDARVVHEDVDPPERVDRAPHDRARPLGGGDGVGVRHRAPACRLDLADHLVRRGDARPGPVPRSAQVVDHDLRPFAREQERVRAADAAARARDDRHLPVEKSHVCPLGHGPRAVHAPAAHGNKTGSFAISRFAVRCCTLEVRMAGDKDDDPFQTGKVTALPMHEHERERDHETVPIDIGGSHPPPRISVKPHDRFPTEPPVTVRVPRVLNDDGWLGEDTSLQRATEKTLSVPTSVNADRATLTVLTGLNAGQILALDGLEHVLGRGTDADLWLEDPAISRSHARVTRRPDGHFLVEDLGSTNGTFVSGRKVEGRMELQSGDRIQIGPTQMLRFAITDDAEEELQRRLYESSTRDSLTRAFNRKYLNERLLAEIAHARRHKTQLALLMLDLDRFKEVNDHYGHLAGDMVLRVVASHMLQADPDRGRARPVRGRGVRDPRAVHLAQGRRHPRGPGSNDRRAPPDRDSGRGEGAQGDGQHRRLVARRAATRGGGERAHCHR